MKVAINAVLVKYG